MMMKSFGAAALEQDEWVVNYRLSHGRGCFENAFCILANRWDCLLTTPPPPPTRAAECRDHGESVYNTS